MSIASSLVRSSIVMVVPCLLVVGCQSTPSATTAPAMADMKPAMPAAPAAMAPAPAAKDMTHVMTMDEPYFDSMPMGASPASTGTLKKGTKLLLMTPGAPYSKVLTETGMTVYTVTDGFDPISTK